MTFLNNLLDFAKHQTRDFIVILRWLVLALFFLTVIVVSYAISPWIG